MNVEIQINNSIQPTARFVTWAPTPCRIRITNPVGFVTPIVQVSLSQTALAGGGSIVFATTPTAAGTPTITLPVPLNGGSVTFFIRGTAPSNANPGISIRATAGPLPILPAQTVGSVPIMVRVRKSANALAAGERNRFVAAMAQLNNQGLGRFTDFRDMHVSGLPNAE
ncbi:MAG: tyrosinase family protein, partial [Acidobacteria bacterium]|nr:tyrosinase family protein [Acidobacteriota bacterium]